MIDNNKTLDKLIKNYMETRTNFQQAEKKLNNYFQRRIEKCTKKIDRLEETEKELNNAFDKKLVRFCIKEKKEYHRKLDSLYEQTQRIVKDALNKSPRFYLNTPRFYLSRS